MKAAVINFPGSNCAEDLLWAVGTVLGAEADLISAKATSLAGYDLVLLPGGFSYGDYLRSGAIAKFAPVMAAVRAHAAAGGFVLGICNGFQILTESGLLPGTLQVNRGLKFICADASLTLTTATPWTQAYRDTSISLPIAHGEGNYYADDVTLADLEAHGQIVFRYRHNPNGSAHDIAGITNRTGNVLGMMPHPERAVEAILGGTAGNALFKSIQEVIDGSHA